MTRSLFVLAFLLASLTQFSQTALGSPIGAVPAEKIQCRALNSNRINAVKSILSKKTEFLGAGAVVSLHSSYDVNSQKIVKIGAISLQDAVKVKAGTLVKSKAVFF